MAGSSSTYAFQKALDLIADTKYDSSETSLKLLLSETQAEAPARHVVVANFFTRNLIQTRRLPLAMRLLDYSRGYMQTHSVAAPHRAFLMADIYLLYGDVAFSDKSRQRRELAGKLYTAARRFLPHGHPRQGIVYRKIGRVNRLLGRQDAVVPNYLAALDLLDGALCRERMRTLQELAIYHYRNQDSALTMRYFGEARALIGKCRTVTPDDEIVQLYYEAKIEQQYRQDLESAQRSFLSATAKARVYNCFSNLLPFCYSALGNIQFQLGFFQDALDTYTDYLDFHRKVSRDSARIARSFLDIGDCHSQLGDFEAAEDYYFQAYNILNNNARNDFLIGNALQNYGQVLINLGHYDQATLYLDSALQKYLRVAPGFHEDIGTIHFNVALANYRSRKWRAAYEKFILAVRNYEKALSPPWADIANAYAGAANALDFDGQQAEAARHLDSAETAIQKAAPTAAVSIADGTTELGAFYERRQAWDQALEKYQKALVQVIAGYRGEDMYGFPKFENAISSWHALKAIRGKANAFRKRFESSRDIRDLKTSLKAYEHAIHEIRRIRQDRKRESSQLLVSGSMRPVFESAIQVAYMLYGMTAETYYLDLAFTFSEQSKGMILLEAISATKAEAISGIPEDILRRRQRLVGRMDNLRNAMRNNGQGGQGTARQRSEFFELENQYAALLDTLKTDYPRYFELVYDFETASIAEVQRHLETDSSALLSYFIGDSALFTFAILPDTVVMRRSQLTEVFRDSLNAFRYRLQTPYPSNAPVRDYAHTAKMLYDTLIGNLDMDLPEVLRIIPDGQLNYVSFDALLPEAPTTADAEFDEVQYLVEDYTMSYDYSATFLLNAPRTPLHPGELDILAMAPSFAGNPEFTELRAAREGVQRLGKRFPNVEVIVDEAATKKRFLDEAGDYAIIDLATHGIVDTLDPMNSLLAFAADGTGDSILYLEELYGMRLNARMAILEACETGTGKHQRGEGVISLARGFTYAGCNTILMSLWQVSESSTSAIIGDFYDGLAKGYTVDRAMTTAKRNFLSSVKAEGGINTIQYQPFFWAELVAIGDISPIPLTRASGANAWTIAAIAGPVLLLLLTAIWFRRRRKRRAIS